MRKLMRREKANIERLKHRMKESKVQEGEASTSVQSAQGPYQDYVMQEQFDQDDEATADQLGFTPPGISA